MFLLSNKLYFKRTNLFGIIVAFYMLTIALIILSFPATGETSPKFLIPNLKAVFENGHIIHYGLSLFPGGTETIYPRLKKGLDNSTGDSVGWGYYDRDKERVIPEYKTWFYLFSHIPRRARASFIYGLPGLDPFMFLPLLNVPELLETYGVVEVIWFATDVLGHMLGQRLRRASVCRFDRYFGRLIKRLNLNE